jgi:hypothetical protein
MNAVLLLVDLAVTHEDQDAAADLVKVEPQIASEGPPVKVEVFDCRIPVICLGLCPALQG